jgi:hypothetical protein
LAERQPAVIGGDFGVGEDDKARVAQFRSDAFEQDAVLEVAGLDSYCVEVCTRCGAVFEVFGRLYQRLR